MNIAEIAALLAEATLASSVAIALVLLLRRSLRNRFGASTGYAAWLLVPAVLLAVSLPAAPAPSSLTPVAMTFVLSQASPSGATAAVDPTQMWMLAWSLGVLIAAWYFAVQQRRFRRALGTLRTRADGLQQASSTRGLPAAFGLLRPRIVVPADFDHRYSAEQRALMQAHEHAHIRRGDLLVNALATVLRCLFWFNPLVHVAARHFRQDQELACDAGVLARHPQARRAYAEALLQAQFATQGSPLGCHFGFGHPLKERITMLKQPVPSSLRWLVGSVVVIGLTLGGGVAAWAAQPAVSVDAPAPPAPPAPPVPQTPPPAPAPAPPSSPAPEAPSNHLASMVERNPPPRYPAPALEQKISGKVVLVIDVDAHGNPLAIQVESSEPVGVFDQSAINAAKQWKFSPALEDGKPVAGRVRVPVEFEITPEEAKAGTGGITARE